MQKLSYLICYIILAATGFAQSPHGNAFKTDCAVCHKADSWELMRKDMTFDHNTTSFKLTGQHQDVDCRNCHQTLKFQDAKSECIACHTDMHSNTVGPDCAKCHSTNAWIVENTKMMHQLSRFPLEGSHALVDCASCHKSSSNYRFDPLGVECIDCHRSDYLATTNPNHQQLNYPTNCVECHDVRVIEWKSNTFNHSVFPLTNSHNINCTECHTGGNYQKISAECSSCHISDFNSAQAPSHSAAGISTDCKTCHTSIDWKPSTFRHNTTGFDLSGAHAAIVQCSSCHLGNTTSAQPDCISCHQAQYNGAKGHVAEQFPTDCRICHNNDNWLEAKFDHNKTIFPLSGAHTTVDCASCHTTGYAGTSTECKSCHLSNFNSAQVPSHTAAGLSTDCKTCHTAVDWKPSSFKHSTTGFDLNGAHAAIVQCSSCHLGNTTSAQPDCITCHQAQYNAAPSHVSSNFPSDCILCHNNNNWLDATFDHNKTAFPLTGSHSNVDCLSCHASGYQGTSMECSSCHESNYNSAANPNHKTLALSTNCALCHTSNPDWQPAKFPDHNKSYTLSGAHAAIANNCVDCHKGNYSNTPNTCYACHTADYNNTTNPSHKAAKYLTDCASCHTVQAWVPSTFNHTNYFPINTSRHNVSCSVCHTSSTNYTIFTCVTSSCHTRDHNQNQGSAGCYRCHPTGKD
jgi:hypothetical protein